MEFLISVLMIILCGFVAHEGIRKGNERIKDLDMSPNLGALIGMFFGVPGLICLVIYGAIKVMIKRMVKH